MMKKGIGTNVNIKEAFKYMKMVQGKIMFQYINQNFLTTKNTQSTYRRKAFTNCINLFIGLH